MPLPKDGSSSQGERLALLERFCELWPTPERCVLLADREFLGRAWIAWLRARGISIVIRLREDAYLDEVMASLQVGNVYRRIRRAVHRQGFFVAPITLAGCPLYYIAVPDHRKSGKIVCLLSESPDVAWVRQAYARRWKIEVFFKQIKTDGFNLEDLHVVDADRVRVLVAVVSFAYALALHQGVIEAKKRPIAIKKGKQNGKSWPAASLFRCGYRRLRQIASEAQRFVGLVLRIL
jgi:hypothetical protein